ITYNYELTPSKQAKHCQTCGKETVTQCLHCNAAIRGKYNRPNVVTVGYRYSVPSFCHDCGHPYPCTQTLLDNVVEIVGFDEDIGDADKDIITSTILDIIIETSTRPVSRAKYKKHVNRTKYFVKEGLRNLLIDLVSECVKKSLWR